MYKFKIYRYGLYKSPINGQDISKVISITQVELKNPYSMKPGIVKTIQRTGVSREDVVEIIDYLNLQSIISVKQNKKPYITVTMSSHKEYHKLVTSMIPKIDPKRKRWLAKYK